MLSCKNISKHFLLGNSLKSVKVLKDVSLNIDAGQITALKGPSAGFTVELPMGSGGSTFGFDYSYRHTNPFQGSHTVGARINL